LPIMAFLLNPSSAPMRVALISLAQASRNRAIVSGGQGFLAGTGWTPF
jgi:hypothetical protein